MLKSLIEAMSTRHSKSREIKKPPRTRRRAVIIAPSLAATTSTRVGVAVVGVRVMLVRVSERVVRVRMAVSVFRYQ